MVIYIFNIRTPRQNSEPLPRCAAQPLSRFAEAIMAPIALVMSKAFFTSVVTSESKKL